MAKEIKEYEMFPDIDITFVKCTYKQEDWAPIVIIVAKEPGKFLRIVPCYDENSFNNFIKRFCSSYNFSTENLYGRMIDTVIIDDENTEYRVICDDQAVSFSVEYDRIRGRATVTRTDFEDYSYIEN